MTENREKINMRRAEDERGVVVIISALAMVTLLVMAAFVIDLGHARQIAREHQAATDGASLAAAQELPLDGANDTSAASARDAARLNIASTLNGTATECVTVVNTCTFTVDDVEVSVTTPYTLAGSSVPSWGLVHVQACGTSPAFLSRVIGNEGSTVCRSAVARNQRVQPGTGIGILALGPNNCTVVLNGTVDVTVTGGAVLANSTGNPAICAQGNGCGTLTIDAVLVAATGTVLPCIEDHTTGEVVSGAAVVPDPFASLPDSPCADPAAIACAGTPAKPTTPMTCGTNMSPGYRATLCRINGNNTINMAPGIYWFDAGFEPGNGQLRCMSGGQPCTAATGGVLLYFFNGSLVHNGNLVMNLLPYQAGQSQGDLYGGLSIYQRRGNPAELDLGGTGAQTLGSVYAKNAPVEMHGTSDRTVDGIIVADNYRWVGNSQNTVNPPPNGPTTDPVFDSGLEL